MYFTIFFLITLARAERMNCVVGASGIDCFEYRTYLRGRILTDVPDTSTLATPRTDRQTETVTSTPTLLATALPTPPEPTPFIPPAAFWPTPTPTPSPISQSLATPRDLSSQPPYNSISYDILFLALLVFFLLTTITAALLTIYLRPSKRRVPAKKAPFPSLFRFPSMKRKLNTDHTSLYIDS